MYENTDEIRKQIMNRVKGIILEKSELEDKVKSLQKQINTQTKEVKRQQKEEINDLKDNLSACESHNEFLENQVYELQEQLSKVRKENFELLEDRNTWIDGSKQLIKEIEKLSWELNIYKKLKPPTKLR